MKKTYQNVILLLLISNLAFAQLTGNSNWNHVGPKSSNQQNGNGFETGQLNKIVIDPNNPQHMFAGGKMFGLWETLDRGVTWYRVNTIFLNGAGISDLEFVSTTEIVVGNYVKGGYEPDHSNKVAKYNFSTATWSALGVILSSNGKKYLIRDIAVYPNNLSRIFACTSQGLFQSTDGGQTFGQIETGFIENIVFLPKPGGGYYWYISGSNVPNNSSTPISTRIFKESSNDGISFTDKSSVLYPTTYAYSHSRLCVGPNRTTNQYELYMLTLGNADLNWDHYGYGQLIDKVRKDILGNTLTGLTTSGNDYNGFGSADRMAIAYDPQNDGLWFGGQKLSYMSLTTNVVTFAVKQSFHNSYGLIHDDMHDIIICETSPVVNPKKYEIFIANDGGIVKASLTPQTNIATDIYFNACNNGLDVSYINGFSGSAQDPNLYASGGFDIINTDIFDASTGKNKYTQTTWENDGTLIDKFNDNVILMDYNSYSDPGYNGYFVSVDGGNTKDGGGVKSFWSPDPASNIFTKGSNQGEQTTQGFTRRLFFQDPYRQGRIFFVKNLGAIFQYDFTNKVFVAKITTYATQQNKYYNPLSSDHPKGEFGISEAWQNTNAISFSQQTPNSMHIALNGSYSSQSGVNFDSRPTILKYVGNNLDDCWNGHNLSTYTDGSGTHAQWTSLTGSITSYNGAVQNGLWENLSSIANCSTCNNITSLQDLANISLDEIETSPWNKNVIYLMLRMPTNLSVSVLKYDGTNWSNYSQGLPVNHYPYSMIMDHASNDGLYLSTQFGVYYRDASMSQWQSYTNNLPLVDACQMEVNYKENSVRAGLRGQGIWKSPLVCPSTPTLTFPPNISVFGFKEADNIITTDNSPNSGTNIYTSPVNPTIFRATTKITLNPGFRAEATTDNNFFQAFIHGCNITSSPSGGTSNYEYYKMNSPENIQTMLEGIKEQKELTVYPNPTSGMFTISLGRKLSEGEQEERVENEMNETQDITISVSIYNAMGNIVYSKKDISPSVAEVPVNLQDQPKGIHLIRVVKGKGEAKTAKIIVQ